MKGEINMEFKKYLDKQLENEEFKKEWEEVMKVYQFVIKEDNKNA